MEVQDKESIVIQPLLQTAAEVRQKSFRESDIRSLLLEGEGGDILVSAL